MTTPNLIAMHYQSRRPTSKEIEAERLFRLLDALEAHYGKVCHANTISLVR